MNDRKKNIIDIIDKLSDLKFQKDVWLDGKYWDRVSSLDEAINLLDDYGFFSNIKKDALLKNDINQIEAFVNKILEYKEEKVSIMLIDPIWQNIVSESRKTLEILKKIWDLSD